MMDHDQTAEDYATKTLITFENIEWRIGNHQSFSSTMFKTTLYASLTKNSYDSLKMVEKIFSGCIKTFIPMKW